MDNKITPSHQSRPAIESAVVGELSRRFVEFVEVRRRSVARGIDPLVREFLAWCRVRRSPKTVESYDVALWQFAEYADGVGINSPSDVDHRSVEQWLGWLLARGVKPATVNARLAALRTFWKWMRRDGLVIANPAVDCERLKPRKTIASYLTISQCDKFLAGLAALPGEVARRDEAMIATSLLAGLRCSELVGLRVEDVNLSDCIVRVLGKGDKEREVPIVDRLAAVLRFYIEEARPRLLTSTQSIKSGSDADALRAQGCAWLFVSSRPTRKQSTSTHASRPWGEALGRHAFNFQLSMLGRQILGRRVNPHMLRHSCASRMRHNGADLEMIAECLGHESIETTRIYAHLSTERRRQALQQLLK